MMQIQLISEYASSTGYHPKPSSLSEKMNSIANSISKLANTTANLMSLYHRLQSDSTLPTGINHVNVASGGQAVVGSVIQTEVKNKNSGNTP
ncbi:MAG: hypothetical protein AAGA27_01165 [Pseudomonadota bacterium]